MRSTEIADDHYGQGSELLRQANAALARAEATRSIDSLHQATALSAVAQGHFHAAMAATAMGTQRELLGLAAGDVSAIERPATSTGSPLVLERVRVEDGSYRVFERHGVGTGSVTYDPANGDYGYLEVDGPLSQEFTADKEERLCHDLLEMRGDDALFERLEYVYQRQRERAATATRPYPSSTSEEGAR